jgi:hypothetical protein
MTMSISIRQVNALAELRADQFTRDGVKLLAQRFIDIANSITRKKRSSGPLYFRQFSPKGRSYVGGFYYDPPRSSGARAVARIYNVAPHAFAKEFGRRPGSRGPNINNPFTVDRLTQWMLKRKLFNVSSSRTRGSSGRFQSVKTLPTRSALFLLSRAISRRGQPAVQALFLAKVQILHESVGDRFNLAKALKSQRRS